MRHWKFVMAIVCVGAAEVVGLMLFASPSSDGERSGRLQPIPLVIQGDGAGIASMENFLKSHPIIRDPETGTKYSTLIVKPDPNTDYKILQVQPGTNTDYSIITLDPGSDRPSSEVNRKLSRMIAELLKRQRQSSAEPGEDAKCRRAKGEKRSLE